MTTLTASASDWDLLNLTPAKQGTYLSWAPVSILANPDTGRVESTRTVWTEFGPDGTVTVEIPAPLAGTGIWLDTGINGLDKQWFSMWPADAVTLVDLLLHYVVDKDTLLPSPSGQAAWDATLALVQAAQADVLENAAAADAAATIAVAHADQSGQSAVAAGTAASTATMQAGVAVQSAGDAVVAKDAAEAAAATIAPGLPGGTAQLDSGAKLPESQVPERLTEDALSSTYVTPDAVAPLIEEAIVGLGPSSGFIVTSDPDGWTVIVAIPEPAPIPLTAPTLTALVPGKSQATATWTAPSPLDPLAPITDYSIRYRIVGTSSWNYFVHAPSTALTRVITGLANGAANQYEVQVAAVNAAGVGAFSTSLTAIPGAVNGVVMSDSGTRTAAELVGSAPDLGPQSWGGTTGNFLVNGSYIAAKSTAAGNLQTIGLGATGLFKLTGVVNVDTLSGSPATVTSRIYLKYKTAADCLYLAIGITTTGLPSFSLTSVAGGTTAALALGMPAGAIPSGAAAADYAFTIEQTSSTSVSVTMNGVTRTVTLTAPQAAALTDASILGLTSNSQRFKYKTLALAVNGYYL